MAQTRHRYLFKNKGNFVYNYKLKKFEHVNNTPMHYEFKDTQEFKQDLWKNVLHKKYFIHCYRVSVSEGLHTELPTSQLMHKKIDSNMFQTCGFCHCMIEIKKAFTQEADTCDYCLKLLENEDKDNPRIDIIWTENQKYVNQIFRYEKIKSKSGKISQEIIEKHVNACDSLM